MWHWMSEGFVKIHWYLSSLGGQRIGIWVTAKDSTAAATVEWIHLPARNKGRHWYFLRPCYIWPPSRWCHSLRKKAGSFSDNPLWKSPHRSQTVLELCVLINLVAAKLTIKNNHHTIDYNIYTFWLICSIFRVWSVFFSHIELFRS